MRKHILKKSLIVGIIILFTCSSFASNISGYSKEFNQLNGNVEDFYEQQENVIVSCRTYGTPIKSSREIEIPYSELEKLFGKINNLAVEIFQDPQSEENEQLYEEVFSLAKKHNLLPKDISAESLKPQFISSLNRKKDNNILPLSSNRGNALFCNFVTYGSGMQFPIIILPRLIPILLTPIPRAFLHWSANEGFTSCGSYLTGTGFMASGMQRGTALGFWGIGFSVFIPPVMAFGFIGYALFATCTAEEIESWPPNSPPFISNEKPPSGSCNIPVSLSELSFQIEDADGDFMSYTVTTNPDIGSGSRDNKKDGMYTNPVSGLKPSTQYRWKVEVADSEDVTIKEFSFMTEELPFNPFDEGWQYRKKIIIDHTKVAGDLTNFPVLVSTTDIDLREKAQDDGDDILFMDDIGVANKLYHEFERYDDSSGELIAWVNVDDISADGDTDLYIYYGNPSSSNQQMPERLWSPYYSGVWHLDTLFDSTVNGNNGKNHGTGSITGKIGEARHWDGSDNDYVTVSDHPSLNFADENQFTLSIWMQWDGTVNPHHVQGIIDKQLPYKGFNLVLNSKTFLTFTIGDGNSNYHLYSNKEIDTEWHHVVAVWDGSTQYIYIDGILDNSEHRGIALKDYSKFLEFGNRWGYTDDLNPFNGILDEVHISNTNRNADWICTEYNNQHDPSSFMSFGPEETGP